MLQRFANINEQRDIIHPATKAENHLLSKRHRMEEKGHEQRKKKKLISKYKTKCLNFKGSSAMQNLSY